MYRRPIQQRAPILNVTPVPKYKVSIASIYEPLDVLNSGTFPSFREAYVFAMDTLRSKFSVNLPWVNLDETIRVNEIMLDMLNITERLQPFGERKSVVVRASISDGPSYVAYINTISGGNLNIQFFDINMYKLESVWRPDTISQYIPNVIQIANRYAPYNIPYYISFEDLFLYTPIALSLSVIAAIVMRVNNNSVEILTSPNGVYKLIINDREFTMGRGKMTEVQTASDWGSLLPNVSGLDTLIDNLLNPYGTQSEEMVEEEPNQEEEEMEYGL